MKSSGAQLARRINGAWTLLQRVRSVTDTVSALVKRWRVSPRQAYRYVRAAEKTSRPVSIPARKIVFTVKIPIGVANALRRLAKSTGKTLSSLVTQALENFLNKAGHGQ